MKYIYGKNVSSDFIINKLNWDYDNKIKKIAKKTCKNATVKITKCDICSETRYSKIASFYGISYVKCNKCNLVYTKKRFSKEKTITFFSKDTYYDPTAAYADKKFLKLKENLIKPKIKLMTKFSKGRDWLDVGSADGSAITIIKNLGFNGIGIEINKKSIEFAKKYRNILLYSKPIETFLKDTNKKFDLISFFGVLDLMPEPMKSLKTSNKLLKKGGIIGIQETNSDSISTFVQKMIKEPDRHMIPNKMIRMFNEKSLNFALKKTGFRPIACWFYGMDMIEFIKYLQRKDIHFKNSELREILINKLNELQKVFDNSKLSDEIFLIAKKVREI